MVFNVVYFTASVWQFGTTALTGAKEPAVLPTLVFVASGQMSRWDKGKYLTIIMKIVLTSAGSLKGPVYSKTVLAVGSCLCDISRSKRFQPTPAWFSVMAWVSVWRQFSGDPKWSLPAPGDPQVQPNRHNLGGFYKLKSHSITCASDTDRFCWFCLVLKSLGLFLFSLIFTTPARFGTRVGWRAECSELSCSFLNRNNLHGAVHPGDALVCLPRITLSLMPEGLANSDCHGGKK